MSAKQRVWTASAPKPKGGYSQGIIGVPKLFTAGIGPFDPETGLVVGTTVEEQTHQVLKNLGAILAASGMGFENVLKATVHLRYIERDFEQFDAVFRSYFSETPPARTTVGSTLRSILVEIDVVAG